MTVSILLSSTAFRGSAVGLVAVAALGGATTSASAAPCRPEVVAEVLAPVSETQRWVNVTCDLKLSRNDVVTKQLFFIGRASSGVKVDCGGATIGGVSKVPRVTAGIVVRSQGETPEQMASDRPESITIANCRLQGTIRVTGVGINGEDKKVTASSHSAGHTQRMQAAAPTGITFSNMTITGTGPIPIYLAPGVTRVTLRDSRINGRTAGPVIYLDAESGHNQIVGNRFDIETAKRELIAVDGSADNRIADNRFSGLSNGGVYVYRNCGEGGTVRHQQPQRNVIEGNEFYYDRYFGLSPAIWLGSRMGARNYCNLDKGFPFGSSADDRDFANGNAVLSNRFVKRPPDLMIRDMGAENRIDGNRMVREASK